MSTITLNDFELKDFLKENYKVDEIIYKKSSIKFFYDPSHPKADIHLGIVGIDMGYYYKNREWLNEQIHNLNRKIKDIAEECVVTDSVIRYWKRKFEETKEDTHFIPREFMTPYYYSNNMRYKIRFYLSEKYFKNYPFKREIRIQIQQKKERKKHLNEEQEKYLNKKKKRKEKREHIKWLQKYLKNCTKNQCLYLHNGLKLINDPQNPNSNDFGIVEIDMRKYYQNKKWLLSQLYEKKKSVDEIAIECGTTPKTILFWKEGFESGDFESHKYKERIFYFTADNLYKLIYNKGKEEWEKAKESYLIKRARIKEVKRREREEYEKFVSSLKILRNILEDNKECYICSSYRSCKLYNLNYEDEIKSEKYEIHYIGRNFNKLVELFNSLGLNYRILKNIKDAPKSIFYDIIINELVYRDGKTWSEFHINHHKYLCPEDCYYYNFHKDRYGRYYNRDRNGNCINFFYINGIILNKDILIQVINQLEGKIIDVSAKKHEVKVFEELIDSLKVELDDLLKVKELIDLKKEKEKLKKEIKMLRNFKYGLKKIESYHEIIKYYNEKLREHIPNSEIRKIIANRDKILIKFGVKANRYIPSKIKRQVWIKYKGRCAYCGSRNYLHIDHIIPYSEGGATSVENLQLLCELCNKKKSDKIDDSNLIKKQQVLF